MCVEQGVGDRRESGGALVMDHPGRKGRRGITGLLRDGTAADEGPCQAVST